VPVIVGLPASLWMYSTAQLELPALPSETSEQVLALNVPAVFSDVYATVPVGTFGVPPDSTSVTVDVQVVEAPPSASGEGSHFTVVEVTLLVKSTVVVAVAPVCKASPA
jgi:hypothetical protein